MNTAKFIKLALLITLGASPIAWSSEVDQFSTRDNELSDSEPKLNEKVNGYVQQAIQDANANLTSEVSDCDEKILYKELRKYFGNHIKGEIILDMTERNVYDTQTLAVKDSIYSKWNIFNGVLLSGPFAKSGAGIGKTIRIGDYVIGVDKFEHMFGRGYNYFKKHYQGDLSVKETILSGARWERFYFGGFPLFTGVFSYGDLVANFNGMRFWNDILAYRPDPMGEIKGPYIVCKDNKFAQVKEVHLADYIDDGFDETVNCSQTATRSGALKVLESLKILKKKHPEAQYLECNGHSEKIDQLREKYQALAPLLINDRGIKKVDYFQIN